MSGHDYDLIVAGGGFAGIACAQAAAIRGARTLVLERGPWPVSRAKTTGIVVKELAEDWGIPARYTRRLDRVRLYSPSLRTLDLQSPGYYFLATDTPGVLRWHVRQAIQAGAGVQFTAPYRGAHREADGVRVNERYRARYLVGCDGARSRVAGHFRLGRNKEFLIGVEAHVEGIDGLDEHCLHVFLDAGLARGYIGWIVPGVYGVQIGLATRYPQQPDLGAFLERLERGLGLRVPAPACYRSGPIPCGGIVHPFHAERIMLLGDAAGMVSPLTAGGIHAAVQFGARAGELIAEHLLHGGPEPGRALARELPAYRYKRLLRRLLDLVPPSNRLCDALFGTPAFRLLAQCVFFHQRGLLAPQVWRDVLAAQAPRGS
ncbi:MAG: NAD(P)/FAD-dependent oxidoreductase [Gammaproteobacteria bacterium]|nr:NAD(P)/FAD-dependent oxidoreductase [Gammaproteobacteria bacterium]